MPEHLQGICEKIGRGVAKMTFVEYHSATWGMLVEQGWTTASVDDAFEGGPRIATMVWEQERVRLPW